MAYRFIIVELVITVHLIQLCRGRYCQEAVNSVKIVDSCPTSKIEWDDAARKKNCIRIALQQYCSPVEKFQYHCVINGYRNETLEVCAPARIIFGNCVEFNVPGGVIQDQLSARCNKIFPVCDALYSSTNAYKYPDCYQLVSYSKIISNTTTTESTPNDGSFKYNYFIILICLTVVSVFAIWYIYLRIFSKERRRTQIRRKLALVFNNSNQSNVNKTRENRLLSTFEEQTLLKRMARKDDKDDKKAASDPRIDDPDVLQPNYDGVHYTDQTKDAPGTQPEELKTVRSDSDNMCDPELPTSNISPAPSSIQSSPSIYADASDNQSEQLTTVQSDSVNMCDPELPTRNISPAPSSTQSVSSGSSIYEDAPDAKCDDPNVLRLNSDQRKAASDKQSEELSTVQSDSDDTQEEHQLENGSVDIKEEMTLTIRG